MQLYQCSDLELLLGYSSLRCASHGRLLGALKLLRTTSVCASTISPATAMINSAERERVRERRLSKARAAMFFLWAILFCALISMFLSIPNESSRSRSSHLIRPHPPPRRERSFSRALFHAPSSNAQARFVGANGDPDNLSEDGKRVIHTGPNPLHN